MVLVSSLENNKTIHHTLLIFMFCRVAKSFLYFDILETQWPIIYSAEYNISFLGVEKLHPFDAAKWGRVYQYLKGQFVMGKD